MLDDALVQYGTKVETLIAVLILVVLDDALVPAVISGSTGKLMS